MIQSNYYLLMFICLTKTAKRTLMNLVYTLQLSIIDNIVEQNQDCEIILGDDFDVDFFRNWSHTCLLNDFSSQITLYPVIKHIVDYTYHFKESFFGLFRLYFVLRSV